jgi:hypothetical protein
MIENRSIAKENNELAAQLRMRAPEQKTMSKLSHQDRWWAVELVCVLEGPACVCVWPGVVQPNCIRERGKYIILLPPELSHRL